MASEGADDVRQRVDAIYRSDSRRVLATLIRLLGDFDLAEEALHDAFAAAIATLVALDDVAPMRSLIQSSR